MVIVFATIVFTGSIVKGARDCVGGFFAKSISTDQESNTNKSAVSAEPRDSIIKTSNYKRKLPRHISITPKNTTNTRCFQSYSSDDFFSCPEEIFIVKYQGDINKEVNVLKETKQVRNEVTTSATVGVDYTMNETGRTGDEGLGSGVTEDQETVEMSIKNDGKLMIASFQTCPSQRSPIRLRRKRPKTLKKELEEAGLLIREDGQTQSTTEPLRAPQDQCDKSKTEGQCDNLQLTRITEEQPEESSLQDQSNEVNTDSLCDSVKQDKPDGISTIQRDVIAAVQENSGGLQSSMDDISITKDEASGSKHHEEYESNCTTKSGPEEEVFSAEDTAASKPVMVHEQLEKENSSLSKTQSKGDATEDKNMNILIGLSNDTTCSSDINTADANKPRLPQEPVCNHHDSLLNLGDLSEPELADAPPVDAGDTVQNQTKHENNQRQGIISETGDYGKLAEINHEEVSEINVDSGRMTRIKHRPRKGIEDNLSLHRDIQRDSCTSLKESGKVDTTKIAEGRVRAYWSLDVVHGNDPRQCQYSDVIVMAVENKDQQRRRMERCQLRERISKATEEVAAITKETERQEVRLIKLAREVGNARSEMDKSEQELQDERNVYRESLLHCHKIEEDAKSLDSRSRAVELELQALKRREWKTDIMLKAARGEIKLLDHRITKEQILQEEQQDKRLHDKRRRFQRTSFKVNTLAAFIILQIILVIIIPLWRI